MPPDIANPISLDAASFHAVPFANKTPTIYQIDGVGLRCVVKASASMLLWPFAKARAIGGLKWQWRHEGEIRGSQAARERTKAGDDGLLKVAVLIEGPSPLVPFLAPAWLRQIKALLQVSAQQVEVYQAGAFNQHGSAWPSPYADSITMHAVESVAGREGWLDVTVTWPRPVAAAGLWLMADGDDTASTFISWIRDLQVLP
jgi:hypothetical protein